MASAASKIAVEITAESAGLQEAVTKAADSLKGLADVVAKTAKSSTTAGGDIVKSNRSLVESFGGVATAAKKSAGTVGDAAGAQADAVAGSAAKIATSSKAIGGSMDEAAAASVLASGRMVGAAEKADARIGAAWVSAGKKTSEFGRSLSSVSLPIAAIGAVSVDMAVKFQASMEKLRTQAGYTQAQVNQLSAGVLKISPDVAQTPDAIAQGLYHIASVGIPAGKALDVVKEAAIGANISGANFEDVANLLGTTLKNYPGIVGGAAGAMGELNGIVGHGNFYLQALSTSLGQVIPTAKGAGLSLRDVGAAIDVMTTHGVPLNMAVTRLRMGLSLMEAPTAKARTALASIGITQSELANDMRQPNGLLGALDDLRTHLADAGATPTQTAQLLSDAFGGARSGAGILSLIQNYSQLADITTHKLPQGTAAIEALQAANRAWENSPQGQLDRLKADLASTAVILGQDLIPVVVPALKELAGILEGLAHDFEGLPTPVRDFIVAAVGVTALASPFILIGGKVLTLTGHLLNLAQTMTGVVAGAFRTMGGAAATASEEVGGAMASTEGAVTTAKGPLAAGAAEDGAAISDGFAIEGIATKNVAKGLTAVEGEMSAAGAVGGPIAADGAAAGAAWSTSFTEALGPIALAALAGYAAGKLANAVLGTGDQSAFNLKGSTAQQILAGDLTLSPGMSLYTSTAKSASIYSTLSEDGLSKAQVQAMIAKLRATGQFPGGTYTPGASGAKAQQQSAAAAIQNAVETPTRAQFAQALLKQIGAPVTSANVSSIVSWESAENTRAAYNPLAITVAPHQLAGVLGDLGQDAGQNGGDPVKNIATALGGVQDTAAFLEQNTPGIVAALKSGTITPAQLSALVTANKWGTESFGTAPAGASGLLVGTVATGTGQQGPMSSDQGAAAGGSSGGGTLTLQQQLQAYLNGLKNGTGSAATSLHFNWQDGQYEFMTAAQYKQLQEIWNKTHPKEAMPTSPAAAKSLATASSRYLSNTNNKGSVSQFLSLSNTPSAIQQGLEVGQAARQKVYTADTTAGTSILGNLKDAISTGSLSSLKTQLNPTHTASFDKIVTTLNDTHKKGLESLATQLVAVHKKAMTDEATLVAAAAETAYEKLVSDTVTALTKQSTDLGTLYGAGNTFGIAGQTGQFAMNAQAAPIVGGTIATNGQLPGLLGQLIPQLEGGALSTSQAANWASVFAGGALGSDFSALASGKLNATDTASTYDSIYSLIGSLGSLQDAVNNNTTATVDNTQLVSLLQEQNTTLSQRVALGAGQTSVLKGFIPDIPHFASGGPVINDGLIYAHKGEYVVPGHGAQITHSNGPTSPQPIHLHFNGDMGGLMEMVHAEVTHPNTVRAISGQIGTRSRMLAGAPGGGR